MSKVIAIQTLPQQTAEVEQGKDPNLGNLVLSGRAQQSIVIGGNIRITILAVGDRNVRLALEAPKNVTIFRQNLLDKMKKTKSEKLLRRVK